MVTDNTARTYLLYDNKKCVHIVVYSEIEKSNIATKPINKNLSKEKRKKFKQAKQYLLTEKIPT